MVFKQSVVTRCNWKLSIKKHPVVLKDMCKSVVCRKVHRQQLFCRKNRNVWFCMNCPFKLKDSASICNAAFTHWRTSSTQCWLRISKEVFRRPTSFMMTDVAERIEEQRAQPQQPAAHTTHTHHSTVWWPWWRWILFAVFNGVWLHYKGFCPGEQLPNLTWAHPRGSTVIQDKFCFCKNSGVKLLPCR